MAIKHRFWPLLLLTSWGAAQGRFMGPPTVDCSTSTPVLMSERVPEKLLVNDEKGTVRPLLSYKAPLEIMVIFFFSASCPPQNLGEFHLFYNKFKEWHVAFVAVSTQKNGDIAALLKKAGLEAVPVVYDEPQAVVRSLNPPGVPWMVVLDEGAHLRYRGPLTAPDERTSTASANTRVDTYQAMDDIIGHVKPVTNPEPGGVPQCALP